MNRRPRGSRADAHFHQAVRHQAAGRLEQALEDYARALSLDPFDARCHNNLGVALRALGRPEAALACYRRAAASGRAVPGLYSNMGNVLRTLGRLDEAAASLRRAVEISPQSADAWRNHGLVLRDLGRLDEAIACFDRSLAGRPDHVDTRWDRAYAQLLAGDLEAGFAGYEARWGLDEAKPRKMERPLWDGGPLQGRTVLLYAEQGFGDTIQFARYLPMAAAGGVVILEVQRELARLFDGLPGVDRLVVRGDPLPPHDVQCPLLSLPWLMGTRLETIPAATPYLPPPGAPPEGFGTAPGVRLRIGISWGGSPTHRNDRNRSIELRRFLALAGRPDVALYSLQKGARAKELERDACGALVRDLDPLIADFADTAAIMQALDLVVTVDTSVAHLAGALGRPVWVLVPYAPDWRWMLAREDSPWYPTMRLFRQERPGDWDGAFARVRGALEELLAVGEAGRAGPPPLGGQIRT